MAMQPFLSAEMILGCTGRDFTDVLSHLHELETLVFPAMSAVLGIAHARANLEALSTCGFKGHYQLSKAAQRSRFLPLSIREADMADIKKKVSRDVGFP